MKFIACLTISISNMNLIVFIIIKNQDILKKRKIDLIKIKKAHSNTIIFFDNSLS